MSASRAVPKDGAARLRAVEARGSVLVQAPAGSGKTTLLTQRYLRLLAARRRPGMHPRADLHAPRRRGNARARDPGAAGRRARAMPRRLEPANLGLGRRRQAPLAGAAIRRRAASVAAANRDHRLLQRVAGGPIAHHLGRGWTFAACSTTRRPLYEEAARRALLHEGGRPLSAPPSNGVLALGDQRWSDLVGLHRRYAAGQQIAGCRCWRGACRLRARSRSRSSRACGGTSMRISAAGRRARCAALARLSAATPSAGFRAACCGAAAKRCAGARPEFAPWRRQRDRRCAPICPAVERWRGHRRRVA